MQKNSRLNKTANLQMRITPSLKKAIVDCAKKLGIKHTEWARSVLANAVMTQCFKPDQQDVSPSGKQ